MPSDTPSEELFFKCPKCKGLYSTTRTVLEQARYTRSTLTLPFLGGRLSPVYVPKCTRCSTKLERISEKEFDQAMEKPP